MYTSGSTGTPEGRRGRAPRDRPAWCSTSTTSTLGPGRDAAARCARWPSTPRPSRSGARCSTAGAAPSTRRRCRPRAGLGESHRRHGVTTMWLTAALFNAVVDEDPRSSRGCEELLIGGEALSVAHVRRALAALPATQLVNGYGPTETHHLRDLLPRSPATSTPRPARCRSAAPSATPRVYVLDEAPAAGPRRAVAASSTSAARAWRAAISTSRADRRAASSPTRSARPASGSTAPATWCVAPDGTLEFLGRATTR